MRAAKIKPGRAKTSVCQFANHTWQKVNDLADSFGIKAAQRMPLENEVMLFRRQTTIDYRHETDSRATKPAFSFSAGVDPRTFDECHVN